jgi:tetratricopeptide (TPR) repeat protein
VSTPAAPRKVEVLVPRDRLESWKEIAAHLNRSERTVRRWEDKEGLPVHRHAHDKRGSVYAFTWELDAWRESRRQLVEAEPPDETVSTATPRRPWWSLAVSGTLVVLTVAGGVFLYGRSASPPSRTPNPEAERLVGLANFGVNAGRTQVETGMRYYQDAIRLDPGNGRAWSGLASSHLVRIWFAEVPAIEAADQARKEAEQARRLDPSLSQPVRVLAGISHWVDWDHVKAEAGFRAAMQVDPKDAVAASWFGDFLLDLRRFDEARVFYARAHDLSPRWLEPIAFAGNAHFLSGNPDLAIVEYLRVLESEPNFGLGNHYLGRALIAKGDYEQGIVRLRKSNELLGDLPFSLADLGYGLAVGGRREEAEALRDDLVRRRARGYYPAFPVAVIEVGLGNTDAALDWLDRAADERNVGFYMPSVDPAFDTVRSHPRFKALLKRVHLDTAGP